MASPSLEDMYRQLFQTFQQHPQRYVETAAKAKQELVKKTLSSSVPSSAHVPYPRITDPTFQEKIFSKKEFGRFQSKLSLEGKSFDVLAQEKCSLHSFQLTPSQKFLKNFLSPITPYRSLLLFHSVGVGKTCTAISMAEQFLSHTTNPKRVLVILSSNIKDNFKQQIFNMQQYDRLQGTSTLCTGTKYPDMVLDKDLLSKEGLEKRIHRLIKERYQFVGYKELVEITKKVMDYVVQTEKNPARHTQRYREKIKEMFSDRLIIVDEAHNLRMPSETGKKQISNALAEVLSIAENTRLVLMTATPMFNSAKEIVWMVNMLLTNDRRPLLKSAELFDKQGALTEKGRMRLEEACRGYVSYMRGENPFSFPFRMYPDAAHDPRVITTYPSLDMHGNDIPRRARIQHLVLVGSEMSDAQRAAYDHVKEIIDVPEEDDDMDVEEDTITNDLQNALQISNVVYPGSEVSQCFGSKGFYRCFERGNKSPIQYKPHIKETYGEFLSYDLLPLYAPKIRTILDYILQSKGIVFLYSQYYYSGIFPLAIALEHIGFTKYNARNATKNMTVQSKFSKGGKSPSYIILSRDKELSPHNDEEIAVAKSKENMHGDIIKVIIVSKVGTEGIDFKNIREVHLLEPWFNLNRAEQIVGRAVRQCSHMALPPAQRNVTIYFHACTYHPDEESIDMKIYRMAETKQVHITQVQKVLKETSMDCHLNREVLIYPPTTLNMKVDLETSQGRKIRGYEVGDKSGSYVCDFGPCDLECRPRLPTHASPATNTSTFDPYFIVDDIDLYKRYVEQAYQQADVYTLEDLQQALEQRVRVEVDVLAYALQELIDQRTSLQGRFGRMGYLLYRGNTYIFQPFHVTETRLSLEEREAYLRKKHKLPLQALAAKQPAKKEASSAAAPMTPSPASAPPKDMLSLILQRIKDRRSLLQSVIQADVQHPVSDRVLLDSVLDRLSHDELIALIHQLVHKPSLTSAEADVQRALLETGTVIVDPKSPHRPKHFWNHHDDKMYTVRADGSIKESGPLDRAAIQDQIKAIQALVQFKSNHIKGYMEFKSSEPKFKIQDNPKGSGYVCVQTSSLKVEDLKERIEQLVPSLLKDQKHVKKHLCDVYEWVLRSQGKAVFQRAFTKRKESKTKN